MAIPPPGGLGKKHSNGSGGGEETVAAVAAKAAGWEEQDAAAAAEAAAAQVGIETDASLPWSIKEAGLVMTSGLSAGLLKLARCACDSLVAPSNIAAETHQTGGHHMVAGLSPSPHSHHRRCILDPFDCTQQLFWPLAG